MAHPPTLLQRTASSGSRSIGAASTNSGSGGEHSRESSRSISNRVTDSVTTGNAPIRLGATQPAAGVTDAIRDATSTRPSLRETLSDGLPPSASDFYNLPSSSVGSTGNLAPPNLAHTLSSSSSVGSPAGSVGSPMSANAPTYTASSSLSASSSIQSSLAGSSSTQQQPPVVTPPLAGPLSSSDQRTSLLVLNLPFKVRWQDVKVSSYRFRLVHLTLVADSAISFLRRTSSVARPALSFALTSLSHLTGAPEALAQS